MLAKIQALPSAGAVARYRWELENGIKEVLPDLVPARELAVALTGAGPAAVESAIKVPISGGELLPSTVVVRTGGSLQIENLDDVSHEVFAVGLDGFGPEAIGPRGTRGVSLTKSGAWPLRDGLTPHARGHLHVIDDLVAVTSPNPEGNFSFDVPDGTYVLHVFHAGKELAQRPVEVAGKHMTLESIVPEQNSGR